MYFRLSDGRAFGLAGMWDRWERGDSQLETCTEVTTDASPLAGQVHNRMPVLLVDDAIERWLDGSLRPSELSSLLAPYRGDDLETYEVSRFVNSPANDSPECISRTEELRLPL
jgi:putative SOS response-associated peptidase YedK